MPTYNDYGIVLNSYNFAEADKIFNIYTRENGLVRGLGKSVRKSGSKFGGRLDQLSCCNFQFAYGKNLDRICDCKQINSFPLLRADLARLTYGVLFLEVVSSFAHEKESESHFIYDLLYSSLDKLQVAGNPELFSIKFILEFLSIHGFSAQVNTCVSCSTSLQPPASSLQPLTASLKYFYSSALGGLLCAECAHLIDHKLVDIEVLKVIQKYETKSNEHIHLALDLLREHIDIRAKSKIKSFDLVFSL